MNVFNLKNATYSIKNKKVLNNINFTLKEGEILSILGQNGVGKTTLIKCLLGFLKFNNDTHCHIFDKPFHSYKPREIWQFISYVAQSRHNNISLKVIDMVVLGLNPVIAFIPNKEHIALSMEILKRLNIFHLKDKFCNALSGGELQMVLFARALVCKPKIIILDEPESNLDFKNQKMILDTLKDLSQNGFDNHKCSIIINTHYPQNAAYISHKSLLLFRNNENVDGSGNLINVANGVLNGNSNGIFGDSKDLLTKENLTRLYDTQIDEFYRLEIA